MDIKTEQEQTLRGQWVVDSETSIEYLIDSNGKKLLKRTRVNGPVEEI